MRDLNSLDYYRFREQKERALAAAALNPKIAAIHLEMAERYAAIIQQSALSHIQNVSGMGSTAVACRISTKVD